MCVEGGGGGPGEVGKHARLAFWRWNLWGNMLLSGAPQGSVGFKVGGVDQCQWWRRDTHTHKLFYCTSRESAFTSGMRMQADNRPTVIYRKACGGPVEQREARILICYLWKIVFAVIGRKVKTGLRHSVRSRGGVALVASGCHATDLIVLAFGSLLLLLLLNFFFHTPHSLHYAIDSQGSQLDNPPPASFPQPSRWKSLWSVSPIKETKKIAESRKKTKKNEMGISKDTGSRGPSRTTPSLAWKGTPFSPQGSLEGRMFLSDQAKGAG